MIASFPNLATLDLKSQKNQYFVLFYLPLCCFLHLYKGNFGGLSLITDQPTLYVR